MKQIIYSLTIFALAFIFILPSCSKLDWKRWKDKHGGKFLVPDCDAKRVYSVGEAGVVDVNMQKTYDPDGRIKTIGFYTISAVSTDVYWHSFTLNYNLSSRTVDIIDSAIGDAVLRAIFHPSGRLERLQRLQGDTSAFADRTFEYAAGRLDRINSTWRTFNNVESFSYDSRGNIVRRVTTAAGETTASEDVVYIYGAASSDKKQFYIPQFNYLVSIDPSMALVEYLGWIDDFSPRNILTGIEYLQPLPHEEGYSEHVFDAGRKLTSYSIGEFAGGTKHIEWRCGK